jgi:CRP-like cAMP-binding protein
MFAARALNHCCDESHTRAVAGFAALAGASREHTNKILVSYKERGYISVDQRHHITIRNQQALQHRCQGA